MSTQEATGLTLVTHGPRTRGAEVVHRQIVSLYVEHHDRLVRLAALVAPEDGLAEDLVQEAFVKLYRTWDRIRSPKKAPAYLRTTVVNLARGRGRRLNIAQRLRPEPPQDSMSAEERVMRREGQREVIACLRRLTPRQRACLVLRHYEGMSESEIATALSISVGSVRTHISRGMTALESYLEGAR